MLTSRAWIIASGLVGAISLMFRTMFNFSISGPSFSLPNIGPVFMINGIIFAVAASASLFGHGSDSPASENHHDDDHYQYEHDHHQDYGNHNQDHELSSKNSSDSSFKQRNNKVYEEEKIPVRRESGGSYGVSQPVSSPEVRIPSVVPEKPTGLRRPPTAPLKTFPRDDKSDDENETMEEMWNRVKAEKIPTTPNRRQGHVASRNDSMSTASCPSPSRARRPPLSQSSPGPSGTKRLERIPTWVKLKKELSMGRDELNSRVEAFIKKFNDEMKLQRLESMKRYKLFRRRSEDK